MIEAIVEANVEKQSSPNLYMKFPFKERSEELQKGHFILGKKVFSLNYHFCASAGFL